jgi:signal transduction histidine kinase
MLGSVHLPDVLRDVARVACEDLHAERATVYVVDEATQTLESIAVIGNVAQTIRVPIRAASLAGYCALTRRAFIVADAYGDLSGIDPALHFDDRWDRLNQFRTRDVLCAPALFKGDVVGVVQVINSVGAPFRDADLTRLQLLARLIACALYHARLYNELATLKALDKQKAQFMRVMIHELKSPVAAAKMMADALQYDDDVAHSPAGAITAKISRRMEQLMTLIRDLLDLARVKGGQPLSDVAVMDLAAETAAACEPYRQPAADKGLAFAVDLPAAPLPARLDVQGYRLVLSNLVSNAVKYTAAGRVSIRVASDGPWATVEVSDTGMGIPAADIPRLFGEFFRATNARQSDIEGSGVGLAGVKSLVERFGGELAVTSRENEGSTFTVRLPLHDAAGDGSPPPTVQAHP